MSISFRQSITFTQRAAGSRTNGHWVEGSETQIPIQASIQPASPSDIAALPEGRRNTKTFRLYSDTLLNDLSSAQSPDIVTLFGEKYEVTSLLPWRNNVINHYKYIVTKVQEP